MNAQFNPTAQIAAAINAELAAIKALNLSKQVTLDIRETCLVVSIKGYGSSHIGLTAPAKCSDRGRFIFLTNILNDMKALRKDLMDFWVEVAA